MTARTTDEAERLAEALCARCWPAGIGDRLDPVAVEWVKRWSPTTLSAAKVRCSCADGRCGVCN